MDWSKYKPLLTAAFERQIALSFKTQLATQPPELMRVMASLEDGSIDPGDFEQVCGAIMKMILAMPEYAAVEEFAKERRREYSEMYKALAAASDTDYAKFAELNQQIAVEMTTEAMFKLLVQSGMLVDKRPLPG
jgi:hypothetical protein